MTSGFDLHQAVTNQIVAAIEAGAGQWVMPWHRKKGGNARPRNVETGQFYKGMNVVSLWVSGQASGFEQSLWGTFKQWKEKGASVRKGEKGTLIVFYKTFEREEEDSEGESSAGKRKGFMAAPSWVFNVAQVEGYAMAAPEAVPEEAKPFIDEPAIECAIRATLADIRIGGAQAAYFPLQDYIAMPAKEGFRGTATSTPEQSYYSTLLHELAHWSGADARLSRKLSMQKKDYAFEELIAELSAAFSCAELGISSEPRADHAQYLASWLEVLKADKHAIFKAAGFATKATDYVLSFGRASVLHAQAA